MTTEREPVQTTYTARRLAVAVPSVRGFQQILDAAVPGQPLTRELASQWGGRGVRVNAIAPGWFPTASSGFLTDPDQVAWISARSPLARPGRLDELDGPLLFLASDASSYLTGETLRVDGGWNTR